MFMFSKKGQKEGGTVAVILVIIAFFMVLYILFIPPSDRDKLLNNPVQGSSQNNAGTFPVIELLTESPGLVSPNSQFGTRHSMQDINLFVKTEPKIDVLSPNLAVKNGLFSKSFPKLKFSSQESSDTVRVSLNFFVSKASGELRIKLNGQIVYSEELDSSGTKIIDIPPGRLQDENELEFSVSSPGIAFWSSNVYNIKDIVIKQEFSKVNSKESRIFSLSDSEAANIQVVTLEYTQVCNERLSFGTTNFLIRINDKRFSDSILNCANTDQKIDLDRSLIVSGKNSLSFELEDGDFSFRQLSVFIKSSDSSFPAYQFSIPTSEFVNVKNNDKIVNINMFFAGTDRKSARLEVNNNEVTIDTSETSFSRDISSLIVEGTNFVRIIPSNTFTLTGLKVELK